MFAIWPLADGRIGNGAENMLQRIFCSVCEQKSTIHPGVQQRLPTEITRLLFLVATKQAVEPAVDQPLPTPPLTPMTLSVDQ